MRGLIHIYIHIYSTYRIHVYIYIAPIYIYIYIYTEHQSHIMRIRQFPEHIKHGVTENKNYEENKTCLASSLSLSNIGCWKYLSPEEGKITTMVLPRISSRCATYIHMRHSSGASWGIRRPQHSAGKCRAVRCGWGMQGSGFMATACMVTSA